MFEYAAARRLALVHGTDVLLDHRPYMRQNTRSYALSIFDIRGTQIRHGVPARGPFGTALHGLLASRRWHVIRENLTGFQPEVLDAPDGTYLLGGYWQDERYFEDHADQIRTDFRFVTAPSANSARYAEEIAATNAVSVHVRRGDYLASAHVNTHGVLGVDYYQAAIDQILVTHRAPHFFVFSDDIEWCRTELRIDAPHTFVVGNEGDQSFEDMRLMAQCSSHIIANSSFSWWGAWLGQRTGSCVIAPRTWFADEALNSTYVLPPSWLRL
jgi:hypothetical protein